MAKIICITTGLTGILNASLELVSRLQNAGHEVIYASPKNVKEKITAEAIPYFQLPEIQNDVSPDLPVFRGPFKKIKRLLYKMQHARRRQLQTLERTIPYEFSQMLRREKPDLVIIDIELHEYIFKAYSSQQNFILLSQWFSLWKRKGLPYLLHDTIPQRGWRGSQWAMTLAWWKVEWQRWRIFLQKKIRSGGTDRRTALRALAQRENFPERLISQNYWPGPFTYSELPVISMTAFEMEFPHEPRPHLFYVGPMVYVKRKEKLAMGSAEVSAADAIHYKNKIGGTLLYCSISTLKKGDESFLKKIIKAVEDRKDWVLILGMGGLIDQKNFDGLSENIFPFSYVPQLKVLREADLSINHGGIHTINECIHFRVPMLIYSGKRSDQNGCAARVHYHQLGIMADKDQDAPRDIREKIETVLGNPHFKKNVEAMHRRISKYQDHRELEKI
ncbi:MAG: nucleotide disphospho-sugar-binding domain-containing protein, partial [Bacteroidota bacterium]